MKALKKKNHPYTGFLYVGLMIKDGEPYLIEYNVRMGDPECQVILPRLKTDLLKIIKHSLKNNLKNKYKMAKRKKYDYSFMYKGYPGKYRKNIFIDKLQNLKEKIKKYYLSCRTKMMDGKLFSTGGRVLNFTSIGNNLLL